MPRNPRVEFPGAFYHVIARGNNRQPIFRDAADFEAFLESLKTTHERFPFTLHAYTLMTNHFHLLVETHDAPLSRLMRSLLTRYSRQFNRRHRRIGHLFSARYKAILCQKDTYLLELVRYIHLNPVRARMVKSPSDWPWSSHRAYRGQPAPAFLTTADVLARFSSRPGPARTAYAEFVRVGIAQGHKKELYPPETFPLLGDGSFVKQALQNQSELRRKPPKTIRMGISDLARKVVLHLNIPPTLLSARARPRHVSKARAVFASLAVDHAGHPVSAVARLLGLHPAAVTKACRKTRIEDSPEERLAAEILRTLR